MVEDERAGADQVPEEVLAEPVDSLLRIDIAEAERRVVLESGERLDKIDGECILVHDTEAADAAGHRISGGGRRGACGCDAGIDRAVGRGCTGRRLHRAGCRGRLPGCRLEIFIGSPDLRSEVGGAARSRSRIEHPVEAVLDVGCLHLPSLAIREDGGVMEADPLAQMVGVCQPVGGYLPALGKLGLQRQ